MLRHSARIDSLEPPALAALGTDPRYAWEDRLARPYDTPISDFELPHSAATRLSEYDFTKIVSSPFRRCLQTAAVVARELGVPTVDVHKGIGEAMAQVKRNGWPDDPDHELSYLSEEEMRATLAGSSVSLTSTSVSLGGVYGEKPVFGQDDASRIRDVLAEIAAAVGSEGGSVLLVTHGDVVGQWVEMVTRETVVQSDYCAWVVYKAPEASGDDGGGGVGASPLLFERVAEQGVTSMLLG